MIQARRPMRVRTHKMLGVGALVLIGAMSYAAGAWSRGDPPFPYDIMDRRMVGDNGTSKETLVEVRPGSPIRMQRKIEYHDPDCERWYARRAVSQVLNADGAHEVVRFDEIHDTQLPVDLSGEWQEWSATLPIDFTCGPAYLAETVTAACTWLQKSSSYFRLHKPDIITRFTVPCSMAGR